MPADFAPRSSALPGRSLVVMGSLSGRTEAGRPVGAPRGARAVRAVADGRPGRLHDPIRSEEADCLDLEAVANPSQVIDTRRAAAEPCGDFPTIVKEELALTDGACCSRIDRESRNDRGRRSYRHQDAERGPNPRWTPRRN